MHTGDIIEDLRWMEGLPNEEMFEQLDPPRNTVTRLYWEPEPERPRPTSSENRPFPAFPGTRWGTWLRCWRSRERGT